MATTFGKAIRKARKDRGISQQELGDLAGTGINFVSQLERGKETVRLDKLLAVLRVLGLTIQLLRGKQVVSVADDLR